MSMRGRSNPVFSAEWPKYAVAAHVLFWAVSACLVAGLVLALTTDLALAHINISLFLLVLVSNLAMGVSAACSGLLYCGNQVFARTPMTGWRARATGIAVALASGGLILFGYALTTIRGG
jgi:hypothetical protein